MQILALFLMLALVQGGRICTNPKGNYGESYTDGCLKMTCKAGAWRSSLETSLCCYKMQPYLPNTTITATEDGCAMAVLYCKEEDGVATGVLQVNNTCGEHSTEEQVQELKHLIVQHMEQTDCDKDSPVSTSTASTTTNPTHGTYDAGDDGAIIESQQLNSFQGATVDLLCHLAPSDDIEWQKEGGSLPDRATQLRTALRIERVTMEDSGKYICTSHGRMQYVKLMVERVSAKQKPEITVRQSTPTAYVGGSIDVTCEVEGLPSRGHTFKWSKVGQTDLEDNVQSRARMMRFDGLTKENNGLYRCTVGTRDGTFYELFTLSVQGSA